MKTRPTITLRGKPAPVPPTAEPERESIASFATLDETLRALADRFGSRRHWVAIKTRERS